MMCVRGAFLLLVLVADAHRQQKNNATAQLKVDATEDNDMTVSADGEVKASGSGVAKEQRDPFGDLFFPLDNSTLARAPAKTSSVGSSGPIKNQMLKKGLVEFVAMTLFVFIGCGSAMAVANQPGWLFQVSLTFGFAISALAYAIGHVSGGQINCAVTFGLVAAGHLEMVQGLVNFAFQLLGAFVGSLITMAVFSEEMDQTKGLGTNAVSPGFSTLQALFAEIVGTFILVYIVLQTAINPATAANRALSCMAIGIAVFLSHSVMIPIDGCSINPTRSFGPMLVKKLFRPQPSDQLSKEDDKEAETNNKYLTDHWIFWVGPLTGALFAAEIYKVTA